MVDKKLFSVVESIIRGLEGGIEIECTSWMSATNSV